MQVLTWHKTAAGQASPPQLEEAVWCGDTHSGRVAMAGVILGGDYQPSMDVATPEQCY